MCQSSGHLSNKVGNVFPGLKWPPFFANFSLMVTFIEKIIKEMN